MPPPHASAQKSEFDMLFDGPGAKSVPERGFAFSNLQTLSMETINLFSMALQARRSAVITGEYRTTGEKCISCDAWRFFEDFEP